MIKDHQVFRLKSLKDNKEVLVEVNYSDKKEVQNSQILKFVCDGNEYLIKQSDLHQLMLTVGNPQVQKDLIPVSLTNIKKMERLLTFKFNAKKAYKKGEEIELVAPWIDTVVNTEEAFAGVIQKKKSNPFKFFTGK